MALPAQEGTSAPAAARDCAGGTLLTRAKPNKWRARQSRKGAARLVVGSVTYDAAGNILQDAFNKYTYDAAGNMLADGANTYAYNSESEIKSAAGVNYTYDGDGDRMQKSSGKIYWYGAGAEILDESDSSGNFTDEYVYFAGKRIAHRSVSSNTIYYYAEDLLGSTRTMVQAGQTSPCYDADFYPFGGERDVTSSCAQNYKFEGKERDTETGNDDFGARYYSWRLGRWLSADWSAVPEPVPYANLTNPQTLNLYSMVRDNQETFADLDGHFGSMGQYAANADFYTSNSCGAESGQSCAGDSWSTYHTDLSTNYAGVDNAELFYYQQADAEDEAKAQQQGYQEPNAANTTEVTLTNVTYNETSGMRADPNAKPGDKDSADQLHDARLAVAEIADRILNSSHPGPEQAPNDLSNRTVADLNAGNKDIIAAHNDSLSAARQTLGGSNTTNGAMHFRTGTAPFKSLYGNKATMVFGPFNSAQGGKVYLTVAP